MLHRKKWRALSFQGRGASPLEIDASFLRIMNPDGEAALSGENSVPLWAC